jgi:hypothetical protein
MRCVFRQRGADISTQSRVGQFEILEVARLISRVGVSSSAGDVICSLTAWPIETTKL